MTREEVKCYCLSFPNSEQAETNDGKWTVFKKGSDVFLLLSRDAAFPLIAISLPQEKGEELIDEYNIVSSSVLRMSGWFDVDIDHNFPAEEIMSWIRQSYDMVCNAQREAEKEKYLSLSKMLGV